MIHDRYTLESGRNSAGALTAGNSQKATSNMAFLFSKFSRAAVSISFGCSP
jgi:hypothetical protein